MFDAASQRYKLRELTTKEAMDQACSVLSGHDDLILQFGEFLPGADMRDALDRSKGASAAGAVPAQAAAATSSDEALGFDTAQPAFQKFKMRLPHENYTELLEILSKATSPVTREGEKVSSQYAEVFSSASSSLNGTADMSRSPVPAQMFQATEALFQGDTELFCEFKSLVSGQDTSS